MASMVTPARKMIFLDGVQFRGAVSEELIQRLGAGINFINLYQHQEKAFVINGNYGGVAVPYNGIDGFTFMQHNAEIVDVFMWVKTAGSAGTTELDIKRATTPGGAFASIFSTTPKITSAAGNNVWIHVGSAVAGTTAPVISLKDLNAGTALRCDLVQRQTGASVRDCGIVVHYRPR